PNGPRLLLYPLEYLSLQGKILPAVAEWKSTDFHSYIFLPLLAGVILLAIVGLSGRRLDLWPVGLGIVAIALGLQSVRWVPVFSLAFAPLAGRALAERWSWALAGNEAPPDSRRSRFHWLLLLVVLAVLVIALRPGAGSQLRSSPRTKGQLVPVDAVNFIADQYPDARIFNQYEWGGYLIYRLWPRNHVLVDGRNDMFDAHFLEDYLHAFSAQRGWQGFLDRYGITVVMVRADSSMAGALETNPRWRLGFQDNLSVVYVRQ
ncbi:MAG: hypothetical protein ACR2PL_15975, partial [Dehalococcoidia bacterium]